MKAWIEKYYRLLAAAIIILYAGINVYCTTRLSITGDEVAYFAYGVNVLKKQPQKELNAAGIPAFNSQMPINALHALPRGIEQLLHPQLTKTQQQVNQDIYKGRLFSVLSALLLALYVLVWATQLYGKPAGIFSLLLYCCCPNIMAHSQLVSTDVFSFLMGTAICYHAWCYGRTGRMQQLLLLALWLGVGQITKQSLLLLYPLVVLWLIMRLWPLACSKAKKLVQFLKELAIIGAISLLIINTGFLFQHTGKSLGSYQFASTKYQHLQQQFSWAANWPLPLPQPYLQGLDYIGFNTETGPGIDGRSSYGSNYFFGTKTDGQWIWYYYPLCWLYKMPLGFLVLLALTLVAYILHRKQQRFWQNESYLLLPAVFIMLLFCLLNTMYLGIRNTLVVAPLLFVFCGSLIPYVNTKQKLAAVAILFGWQLVSIARWFPHFLPYTNELVWNKKNAHKIFTDSNIYFQEAGILVGEYLQRHPDIQFEPAQSVKGKVMVSVEAYYDWWNQGKMQWLRDLQLQPVDHFDSGFLIFDVR